MESFGTITGTFKAFKDGNLVIDNITVLVSKNKLSGKSITSSSKKLKYDNLVTIPDYVLDELTIDTIFKSYGKIRPNSYYFEEEYLLNISNNYSNIFIEEFKNIWLILLQSKDNTEFFINSIPYLIKKYCDEMFSEYQPYFNIDLFDIVNFCNHIDFDNSGLLYTLSKLFEDTGVPNPTNSECKYWIDEYDIKFLKYSYYTYLFTVINNIIESDEFKKYILNEFLPLTIKTFNRYNSKEFDKLYQEIDKIFTFFKLQLYTLITDDLLFNDLITNHYNYIYSSFKNKTSGHIYNIINYKDSLSNIDFQPINSILSEFKRPSNYKEILLLKEKLEKMYFEFYHSSLAWNIAVNFLY
jgi:hypothetical protein